MHGWEMTLFGVIEVVEQSLENIIPFTCIGVKYQAD
jgi:hypothetical protein